MTTTILLLILSQHYGSFNSENSAMAKNAMGRSLGHFSAPVGYGPCVKVPSVTMVPVLYGSTTIIPVLRSIHCYVPQLLWSLCYGPSTMALIATASSAIVPQCYGPSTVVPQLADGTPLLWP